MRFVVTGGRGFIGSHFVEKALSLGHKVFDIDKMTYAANKNLPWDNHKNYEHICQDITELKHIPPCDYLINFAAESHVDNSIVKPHAFVNTNIFGTYNLLQISLKYQSKKTIDNFKFIHISTDEVYGSIKHPKLFTEKSPYNHE